MEQSTPGQRRDRQLAAAIYATALLMPLAIVSVFMPQRPIALPIAPCWRFGGEWWASVVQVLGVVGAVVAVALAILCAVRGGPARVAGIIALAGGAALLVPTFFATSFSSDVLFHPSIEMCPA